MDAMGFVKIPDPSICRLGLAAGSKIPKIPNPRIGCTGKSRSLIRQKTWIVEGPGMTILFPEGLDV